MNLLDCQSRQPEGRFALTLGILVVWLKQRFSSYRNQTLIQQEDQKTMVG
jgi:hypothetical protein